MIKRAISTYIHLGTVIRFLQDAKSSHSIHKDGWILENIEKLFEHLDNFNLKITKNTDSSAELRKLESELKKRPLDETLNEEDVQKISGIAGRIKETLYAEADSSIVYIITEKRWDTDKLLNNISGILAPHVFENLMPLAKKDIEESAKCITFNLPTASAFHALRATEETLRNFYKNKVKKGRVKSNLWGDIIFDMRKRPSLKKYKILLDSLDNIRTNYRNPTQHPEKNYDIEEAQDLFSLCIEALNKMHQSIL